MLVMAAANSITLIITIVRPTPQYAVQGVLLQVGARTEATLSKGMLDMEEEAVPGTPVETGWLPPGKFQPFQNSGNTFVDPLEMPSRVNTVPLHNTELISTSTPSLYLLPRAPCGDSSCGGSHLSATRTPPKPETTKSVHKSSTARPTATKSEQKKLNKVVKPDAIIELVVGLLGACLMRV